MQKNVTIFTNDFAPGKEGVSNDLHLLFTQLASDRSLNVSIHDISRNITLRLSSSHISYGLFLLPIGILLTKYKEITSDLIHIFGSLTGKLYIKLLKRHPILLTNSSAIQESRVEKCKKYWAKLDQVVVECRRDLRRVIDYGIPSHKVSLIYPAVNTSLFSYRPPPTRFTVGFASSPIAKDKLALQKRGVDLLLALARELPDVDFVLLWRERNYDALKPLITNSITSNVSLINRILPDMIPFYGSIHCIILPTTFADDCKPCPTSIMESLAAGKPVLVSNNVGIADLILETRSGLVFTPELDDMITNLKQMRDHYIQYQSKARDTAEQYFSFPRLLDNYKNLYNRLFYSQLLKV